MALLKGTLGSGLWSVAAGLALLGARPVAAQSVRASASEVQAVFLFNFAQFVEWPGDAFPDPQAPLVIGILGKDPFGSFLDETVRGEKVKGRSFRIDRYRRVEEVKDCQILFMAGSGWRASWGRAAPSVSLCRGFERLRVRTTLLWRPATALTLREPAP